MAESGGWARMSGELEEIRAQAAEVKAHGCNACWDCLTTLSTNLDRAIAIAESRGMVLDTAALDIKRVREERDQALAFYGIATKDRLELERQRDDLETERDEARAEYADLDQATRIRINELNHENDQLRQGLFKPLDEARADAVRWKGMHKVLSDRRDELIGQVDEARVAVLALRKSLLSLGHSKNAAPVLADTEHYEQYRPVTSVTPTQEGME